MNAKEILEKYKANTEEEKKQYEDNKHIFINK